MESMAGNGQATARRTTACQTTMPCIQKNASMKVDAESENTLIAKGSVPHLVTQATEICNKDN